MVTEHAKISLVVTNAPVLSALRVVARHQAVKVCNVFSYLFCEIFVAK